MRVRLSRTPSAESHRGLRAVALFELGKGTVAASAATALFVAGPQPLRDALARLGAAMHFHPQHSALGRLVHAITPGAVQVAATAVTVYAVMRFVLAWGLWRTQAWASWLGAATVALYLPFSAYALWRSPGWLSIATVAVNLTILLVLVRDLRRRGAGASDG
jgi:uncharacterized membrane protein (DUF2068 family)